MPISLICGPYFNLMISLTSIKGDNPYPMCPNIKDSDNIVALWDGVSKWFCDSIQFTILNTHPQYELFYVGDMLLVWFRCKYNNRTPWYFTLFGPPVGKELLDFLNNDF